MIREFTSCCTRCSSASEYTDRTDLEREYSIQLSAPLPIPIGLVFGLRMNCLS